MMRGPLIMFTKSRTKDALNQENKMHLGSTGSKVAWCFSMNMEISCTQGLELNVQQTNFLRMPMAMKNSSSSQSF